MKAGKEGQLGRAGERREECKMDGRKEKESK
jgi:hypothetical protein